MENVVEKKTRFYGLAVLFMLVVILAAVVCARRIEADAATETCMRNPACRQAQMEMQNSMSSSCIASTPCGVGGVTVCGAAGQSYCSSVSSSACSGGQPCGVNGVTACDVNGNSFCSSLPSSSSSAPAQPVVDCSKPRPTTPQNVDRKIAWDEICVAAPMRNAANSAAARARGM